MSTVRIALAVAFLTSISAAAAAQPASCTVSEADVVCTEQGPVSGVPEGDTLAFKGNPVRQAAYRDPAVEAAGSSGAL